MSSYEINSEEDLTLFHILWEDILFKKVVPYLSLKDLFNLRCCSKTCKSFVDQSFTHIEEICFAGNNSNNIHLAFKVLAENCYKLKILNLAKCIWLTDDLLIPLLNNNNKLKFVNLNECTSVSVSALQPIIIECRQLKVLKLSKCQWLTTGAVDALTLHQCNLEEFDISHCYAIGERCLLTFFRKFDKLQILSLAFTPSVTDNVLRRIGIYCKSLQHINLVGCENISDIGIEALTSKCSKLQSLMIQKCPKVSERSLSSLRGKIYIDKPCTELVPHPFYFQV